jgi:hypothetical protein
MEMGWLWVTVERWNGTGSKADGYVARSTVYPFHRSTDLLARYWNIGGSSSEHRQTGNSYHHQQPEPDTSRPL